MSNVFGKIFRRRIYLDYASLTPVDPRVIREMRRFSAPGYANPSSLYREGAAAKKALNGSRAEVAGFIHGHVDEIIFTSGGTEANNLALLGALKAFRSKQKIGDPKAHLIISSVEHSSILECAAELEKWGVEVTRLSVDQNGIVSLDELKKALRPTTFLVSIMAVNNEIGTIEPLREIAKVIRHFRARAGSSHNVSPYPLLHTDAAQAALYEDLNVEKLGVDLMTLDGSKVYGPRGVGALYIRRNTPFETVIYGGGQERGIRSGTENIPAIAGLAKALEIAGSGRAVESRRIEALKWEFWAGLQTMARGITCVPEHLVKMTENPSFYQSRGKDMPEGHSKDPLRETGPNSTASRESFQSPFSPHILNVSIPGIDNEFFVLQLDAEGIASSTKSSCLRDADESYVLQAVGRDSKTSVRFSFGRWTKKGDIRKALKVVFEVLGRQR